MFGALACSLGCGRIAYELSGTLVLPSLASPAALVAASPSLSPLLYFGAFHVVTDVAIWIALGTLTTELAVHHAAVLVSHVAVWAAGGFGALHVALLYALFSHSFCMGMREHATLLLPRRAADATSALATLALVLTFIPIRWTLLPVVLGSFSVAVFNASPYLAPVEWAATAAILACWAILAWLSAVWTGALWRQVGRAIAAALREAPPRVAGAPLCALLHLAACLQCRRARVVWRGDDPAELAFAASVLRASVDKGAIVEARLALPAWAPLRPVESVSGTEWRDGAAAVASALRAMQWRERLPAIVERACDRSLSDAAKTGVATAATAADALSRILHELSFGEPPSDADAAVWVGAAAEFKKELAMRGRGSTAVKVAALARAEVLLHGSSSAAAIATVASASHVLQPFILSPIINIGDGLAEMALALAKEPSRCDTGATSAQVRVTEANCLAALVHSPPFPIFERFIAEPGGPVAPGTHVFILSDRIAASLTSSSYATSGDASSPHKSITEYEPARDHMWIAFGAGPRACPGQALALALMASVGDRLLHPPPPLQSRLWDGHLHSGRHNDAASGVTSSVVAWQAATTLRVLAGCIADGLRTMFAAVIPTGLRQVPMLHD